MYMYVWCRLGREREYGGAVHKVRHDIFWLILTPSPLSHFVTHSGTPQKYVTHLGPPPRFLVRLVQRNRTKAPCTNSLSFVRGGFCPRGFVRGSFVWKVLSAVVCVRSPSVRIHLLQQNVKHHFKFHVPLCMIKNIYKCDVTSSLPLPLSQNVPPSLTPCPPRA